MKNRVHEFITETDIIDPTLVFSLDNLYKNYHDFVDSMPGVNVHYAVKANPHLSILEKLSSYGCKFDAASLGEIKLCLEAGAKPSDISFGNTVKAPVAIKAAYDFGIDLFVADSFEEVEKIAAHAPGTRVYFRALVRSSEAEWPLSRKFGCSLSMILPLMNYAKELGLFPVGISFHVGSQTRHPHMWFDTLDTVAMVWDECKSAGHELYLLNIGGGFPSYYGVDITEQPEYGEVLSIKIKENFPGVTYLMAEPGRSMVANLGSIAAKVLLVSHKTIGDPIRWVYLNVGRFGGLAETEDEAIKYRFIVSGKENEEVSECILAGPTCDSADIMYETHKILLPESLCCGDTIIIENTGAYTMTYSSTAFNGFQPLAVHQLKD